MLGDLQAQSWTRSDPVLWAKRHRCTWLARNMYGPAQPLVNFNLILLVYTFLYCEHTNIKIIHHTRLSLASPYCNAISHRTWLWQVQQIPHRMWQWQLQDVIRLWTYKRQSRILLHSRVRRGVVLWGFYRNVRIEKRFQCTSLSLGDDEIQMISQSSAYTPVIL